jgi:RNA polymerase sigma-70 factor (ECF subfamily)
VVEELEAARRGDQDAFARVIAPFRRELRAHCYRMAGSLADADDLLQDSLIRAWRGLAGFEGRASLRTWLYKVTTHACLDALDRKAPRLLPMDLGEPSTGPVGPPIEDAAFIEPCPPELYTETSSPESRYARRESVALAFLVALQLLTPKQRAALILCEVVGMEASECAELLGLSVGAVTSALQRAREVLAKRHAPLPPLDPGRDAVLARYVAAWERADSAALVALLRDDATLAMPPLREWLLGSAAIGASIQAMVFASAAPGVFQLVPLEANGLPGFAAYAGGHALAIHLVDIREGKIAAITAFLSPRLFPAFGQPLAR